MCLDYRLAELDELPLVASLISSILGRPCTEESLSWFYGANPARGENLCNYIAIDSQGEVVGHTAFMPVDFVGDGRRIKAALSVGSFVRSDHGGIFPKLYADLERIMIQSGFDLLYAFPNENSYPFFRKLFRYQEGFFKYASLSGHDIDEIPKISYRLPVNCVCNPFSAEYLKWRVKESPLFVYETLETESYRCIVKNFAEEECDLIAAVPVDNTVHISDYLQLLRTQGSFSSINLYCTEPGLWQLLLSLGFNDRKVRNRFVVKILSENIGPDTPFFLQMIDSDVF